MPRGRSCPGHRWARAGLLVGGRLRCDPRDPGTTQRPLASADGPGEPSRATPRCCPQPRPVLWGGRGTPGGKHVRQLWPSVRVTLVGLPGPSRCPPGWQDQLGRGFLHPVKPVPLRPGAAGGRGAISASGRCRGLLTPSAPGKLRAAVPRGRVRATHLKPEGRAGAWKPSSQAGRGRHLPRRPPGPVPGPPPPRPAARGGAAPPSHSHQDRELLSQVTGPAPRSWQRLKNNIFLIASACLRFLSSSWRAAGSLAVAAGRCACSVLLLFR